MGTEVHTLQHCPTVSKLYHSYFRQAFLVTALQEVSYFKVREGMTERLFYKTAAHSSLFRVHTLLWED